MPDVLLGDDEESLTSLLAIIAGNAAQGAAAYGYFNNGVLPYNHGGTGFSTYTKGDLLYASANNTLSKLAANSTGTKKFLTMTSSVPSWGNIAFGDLPTLYWANVAVSSSSSTTTEPTVKSITIGGATITWVAPVGTTPGYLKINSVLLTDGDQIVGNGTPGGGGGGGASYLYELKDFQSGQSKATTTGTMRMYQATGITDVGGNTGAWKYASPSDVAAAIGLGSYVLKAGDTMTGQLAVTGSWPNGTAGISITNNTTSGGPWMLNTLVPNMSSVGYIVFGKANSAYNAGSLSFGYAGAASTSNYVGLGVYAHDNLFKVYGTGNAWCGGNIEAAQFVRTGGTSSQFLKADGSVDSTTYLPLSAGSGKALTGDLYVGLATSTDQIGIRVQMKKSSGSEYYQTCIFQGLENDITLTYPSVILRKPGSGSNDAILAFDNTAIVFAYISPGATSRTIATVYHSENFKAGTNYQAPISGGTGITFSNNVVSVTANTYAPYNSYGYLPLNGGTLSNSTRNFFNINSTNATGPYVQFQINGSNKGYIGYYVDSGVDCLWLGASTNRLFLDTTAASLRVGTDSTNYVVWHQGNSGTGFPWGCTTLSATDTITMTKGSASVKIGNNGCISTWSTGTAWNEGIRIHSSGNWATIALCGADNTGDAGTSTNTWSLHNYSGNLYLNRNASSGETAYLLCNVSGNWGLGVNTPEYKLHISGTTMPVLYALLDSSAATENTVAQIFQYKTSPYGFEFRINGANGNAVIQSRRKQGYGSNEKFNIVLNPDGGNVGVGKSPGTKLDVAGIVRITHTPSAMGGTYAPLQIINGSSSNTYCMNVTHENLPTGGASILFVGGKSNSTRNSMSLLFHYVGNGSTSNWIGWGFYAADDLMKLTASGTLTTTGDQVISSDINLKENIKDLDLTVEQIAQLPAVTFDWKDGRGSTFGTVAQGVLPIFPQAVRGNEGNYSVVYGQGGWVFGVKNAREIVSLKSHETEQDKEIKKLKVKVKELEAEVQRLRMN